MKLNGGFAATITGIILTSSIGGLTYIVRSINATSERLAVVETKMDTVETKVDSADKRLRQIEFRLSAKWESIHAALAELLDRKNERR